MNKVIVSVSAILVCLALSGCGGGLVGVGVSAMGRAAGTGDTYQAWKPSMPAIPPASGRLFVYVQERSNNIFSAYDLGTGSEIPFAVDSNVCDVIGSSFSYVDLPVGTHDVSADDMSKTFFGFRKGKFDVKVNIAEGHPVFVRIDKVTQDGIHAVPRLVDATTAEAQMSALPLDKHFVSFECGKHTAEDRGA